MTGLGATTQAGRGAAPPGTSTGINMVAIPVVHALTSVTWMMCSQISSVPSLASEAKSPDQDSHRHKVISRSLRSAWTRLIRAPPACFKLTANRSKSAFLPAFVQVQRYAWQVQDQTGLIYI